MKIALFFLLICIIGTCALWATKSLATSLPIVLFGLAALILLVWLAVKRFKQNAVRKHQERLFNDWSRSQSRFRR